ncbi:septation ring formation regulator EzrA [Bacillus norwichensis]|uniref:Septation ring formation regulator EzrA n=1 Tax=Bacillus norwichensis TaxID=2762217 RepID=A0ABR8VKD5_9BACI|nr:septation ring formation regulator EzrA [Bacillus norwichensis]MBD8005218.1 septation ring formation regulator EzrA [Bacillus norwichensis]
MKYGVELVISAIIFIIIIFIIGYKIRKKYYKEIDQLEAKKIETMNKPVVEKLAKVKQLNMTGKTEEMFEEWRKTWDDIITVRFPHIDELLFEAEEYTDKFNFKKVKEARDQIESELSQINQQMQKILDELKELTDSEEKGRTDIESLKEIYGAAKKSLLTESHTFGEARKKLEELLESAAEKISKYETLVKDGDYIEAHKEVVSLSKELEVLVYRMDKIPDLLTDCQTIIPSQKDELLLGYKEMQEQGYVLDHIQMEALMEKMEEELNTYKDFLIQAEVDEVAEGLEEIKEQIEVLYDLLEKEVYARHDVLQKNEETGAYLNKLKEANEQLKSETELVQESYQLFDNDLDVPQNLEKSLGQLMRRYELLEGKIQEDQLAFTSLSGELNEIESGLEQLETKQRLFAERLQSLRKDELEAKEKIALLKRKVSDITRLVQKSKMPGLPSDIESLYEQASEQIEDVFRSLLGKPLNMKSVQSHLYEATDTVDHLYSRTEEHIENARLAEQVIQYGNRYRSQSPQLREDLEKAEKAFRNYEYRSSLEQAAAAVEKLEPGALKKIEEMFNEEIRV